ncbi:MAG: HU family DNA-binding protein [Candidatus Competibacteraceae bacterium]|nr:HU family DNA-binding protein [Candidatus Competibacteraceae bacterium]
MSSPSASFRLFYPDTNTVNAVALHDATGAALTPQTISDGSDDPVGFKSKVLIFAAASEPLFASPTLAVPGSPVSVYLTRDDAGVFKKVLDETTFNSAAPGRPTIGLTALQEHLLFTATDLGGGIKTYAVKAPVAPVAIIKDAGKDPITGADLDGNNILFRWTGLVPTLLEVEADVEDITDPAGFFPVPVVNATTYAESSVGLSLIKSESQVVPRDGLGHGVNFRLRYNVGGDAGAWVAVNNAFITFQLAAPNPPTSLTATVLRDRTDTIPDVVKLDWVKDAVSPGTGIEIFVTDYLGKKHSLYTSNGSELTARIENVSRFVVQDTGPAVARPYTFSIVATNLSASSEAKNAGAAVTITSKVKPSVPLTPDEVAGTAVTVPYATLKANVFADVLTALGTLPAEGQAIVNAAIDKLVLKIKDVVRLGGNVTLADFGSFEAKWMPERLGRNPSTGAPILTPAYRNLYFAVSLGFKKGTRAGTIMTDAQAKPVV